MIVSLATFEHLPKRVGGLGEAATSIGENLATENDVMVFMPSHGIHNSEPELKPKKYGSFTITSPTWSSEVTMYEVNRKGVKMYLLSDEVLDHPEVYMPPEMLSKKLVHFALAFPSAINLLMSKEHKKPDIVHVNDWHCVLGGVMVKKFFNIPMIYTIHRICKEKISTQEMRDAGLDFLIDKSCIESVNGVEMFNLETYGCMMCDRVNTVSYSYLNEEWNTLFGRYSGKATYVWNGMDYSFWDMRKLEEADQKREVRRTNLLRSNGLEDGPMFFFVGRFDMEQKGVDHLLEACDLIFGGKLNVAENVREAMRVVILGSGDPRLEKLAKEVEARYPQNVKIVMGYLSREVTREYYGASDFTMVPSNFEPFGLVQLEAMCMGSIPIGSAVGGIKDTVIDISAGMATATGKLVPPRNPEQLAWAMVEMATLELENKEVVEKIRSNGRPHVISNFTWGIASEKYMDLYEGKAPLKLPFADYEGPI